jgi:hypothetical protein
MYFHLKSSLFCQKLIQKKKIEKKRNESLTSMTTATTKKIMNKVLELQLFIERTTRPECFKRNVFGVLFVVDMTLISLLFLFALSEKIKI